MATYRDVTMQQKADALRLLIADVTPRDVSERVGLTKYQLDELQKRHGHPSPGRMQTSLDMLEQSLREAQDDKPGRKPRPAPAPGERTATSSQAAPAPAPVRSPLTDDLCRTARDSGNKQLAAIADRFEAARKNLVLAVQDWQSKDAERRAAAEAKAKRDAEIAALERRLAELRGKPLPKPPRATRPVGEYPCDGCDRTFVNPQGRASHKRIVHDGWKFTPDGWAPPTADEATS